MSKTTQPFVDPLTQTRHQQAKMLQALRPRTCAPRAYLSPTAVTTQRYRTSTRHPACQKGFPVRHLLLGVCTLMGCDSLWSSRLVDDPANCVQTPSLCQNGQVCNLRREVCEPGVVLEQVEPARAPSTGGTPVQITGDHFIAGMTVRFSGVAASQVTVLSPQRIQAIVPAIPGARGYVPVSVASSSEQEVSRSDLFSYYPGTVQFQPAKNRTTGSGPQVVAVADLNHDKRLDLATADYGSSTVSVLFGNGDGTFQDPKSIGVGANPLSVQTADLNGDGNPDLFTANYGAANISILLGKGDGTFAPVANITTGTGSSYVTAGFVDQGNTLDLAVANHDANTISILLGKGDGTFQPARPLSAAAGNWLAFADLGAGRASDLIVATDGKPEFYVYLSNQDGTYQVPQTFAVGQTPRSLAVADFNRDGLPDVAVADFGSADIAVLLGGRNPLFQAAKYLPLKTVPYTLTLGDLNGDGAIDIVTGNPRLGNVSWLLGNGDGTFHNERQEAANQNTRSAGLGDWNGDGLTDIAAVNFGSNDISVLLNSAQ